MVELHAVEFPGVADQRYRRMRRVLEYSAAKNSPATPLTVHEGTHGDADLMATCRDGLKRAWFDNYRKARHHYEVIQQIPNGRVIGMLDLDTMILGDISEVEALDFDIALTVRPPGSAWKINTGVYFVRKSDVTDVFFYCLQNMAGRMAQHKGLHDEWRKGHRFGGIHQAAFGAVQEDFGREIEILELPCERWNCVPSTIHTADNPLIVHIMGQLREWVFGRSKPRSPQERHYVQLWHELERQATEQVA